MKYVDEFRDGRLARQIAATITAEVRPDRGYSLMEFCGGHTHAICRYGLEDLLPANIRMIHGPGCPVCVLPIGRLDMAVELARRPEVILCIPRLREMSKKPLARRGWKDSSRSPDWRRLSDSGGTAGPDRVGSGRAG
jgi:hydrogenase expression/formation protein HypD